MLSILGNDCGTCTACCTVLGVQQLRKDAYESCSHLCSGGCGVYQIRPTECKTYQCFWLSHNGRDEELRPDNLGVILEFSETTIGLAVVVREVWQGAFEEDLARQYVGAVAERSQAFIFVVRPDNTRSTFFPPWVAHLAKKAVKFKMESWKEVEERQQNLQIQQQKSAQIAKNLKKNRKDMAKRSKKRNR